MELPPKYASAVLHLDKNKKQKTKTDWLFNFKWFIVEYSRFNHYDVT
jgi:hypothetical protein